MRNESNENSKKNKSLLIIILNIIFGLGHFYAGYQIRGVAFAILFIVTGAVFYLWNWLFPIILYQPTLSSLIIQSILVIIYVTDTFRIALGYRQGKIEIPSFAKIENAVIYGSIVVLIIIAVGIIPIVFPYEPEWVPRNSPTGEVHDFVFIDTDYYDKHNIERHDYVTYEYIVQGETIHDHGYVIGLPGDVITNPSDKYLAINGEMFTDTLNLNHLDSWHFEGNTDTFRIPDGYYFLLDENRHYRLDFEKKNRPIEKSKIIGKIVKRYWSTH